jgi:hypothetical protein
MFGGLGNQLFCWAAALALARRNNLELALECGSYKTDSYGRRFALAGLGIVERTLTFNPLEAALVPALARISMGRRGHVHVPGFDMLTDPGGTVNARLMTERFSGRCYLRGYWQSAAYFQNERERISQAVTLAPCRPRQLSPESVCVHIRSYKEAQLQHVDRDYYLAAYAACMKRLKHPNFVVYSDDLEWAREHEMLPPEFEAAGTFHDGGCRASDLCELVSMSRFPNFIIANSTFSWWAAYLGGRTAWVQAPAASRKCWTASDPLPADWSTL